MKHPLIYIAVLLLALTGGIGNLPAGAAPPDNPAVEKTQRLTLPAADEAKLLRIWIVNVGQGDGILIQLPENYDYPVDAGGGSDENADRTDILIDGGSFKKSNAILMRKFLLRLYDRPTVEYAVISHHDSDHVRGLIRILQDPRIAVDAIFHSGLATYRNGFALEVEDNSGKVRKETFSDTTSSRNAVIMRKKRILTRGMAFLDADDQMKPPFYIETMDDLDEHRDDFGDVYEALATAILNKENPRPVQSFQRVHADAGIYPDLLEAAVPESGNRVTLRTIWPDTSMRKYGGWSETINGNSVTMRLDYGDFSMLFSGDHNEKSETALMAYLRSAGRLDLLQVDVLKVPHHGSGNTHAYKPFFDAVNPVVSVASMGSRGFTSSWKHPNPELIEWLGGPLRVYSTYIEEKSFTLTDLKSKRAALVENSHILIETDGHFFRIVELEDPSEIPTMAATQRGDGTRWIQAR